MGRAPYDEIAGWYDEAVRGGPLAPFHEWVIPIVLDLAGEVKGRRVCDLACGQGIVARELAEGGAEVVGVDVSAGMLDLARSYERDEPRGITYIQGDAQTLDVVGDNSFDGVVCNTALMDIPDLAATLRAVSRILRPRGWFVFSVVHPFLQTPGSPRWVLEGDEIVGLDLRNYFAEGFWRRDHPDGLRGRVGAYHRTLSTYVNELSRSGLAIERLLEPRATGRFAETTPVYEDVPVVLVVRCEKSGTGGTERSASTMEPRMNAPSTPEAAARRSALPVTSGRPAESASGEPEHAGREPGDAYQAADPEVPETDGVDDHLRRYRHPGEDREHQTRVQSLTRLHARLAGAPSDGGNMASDHEPYAACPDG